MDVAKLQAAQIVQLERQVALYKGLVTQHHSLLQGAVYPALGGQEGYQDLRLQTAKLMKDQAAALGHGYFDQDHSGGGGVWDPMAEASEKTARRAQTEADEEHTRQTSPPVVNRPPPPQQPRAKPRESTVSPGRGGGGGGGSGGSVSPEAAREAAQQAAERIQRVTVRLLNIWHEHVMNKIRGPLRRITDEFQTFSEQPEEGSLNSFLTQFQQSAESIADVCTEVADDVAGPAGNPFALDGRLLDVYTTTIADAIATVHPPSPSPSSSPPQRGGSTGGAPDAAPALPPRATSSERPPRVRPLGQDDLRTQQQHQQQAPAQKHHSARGDSAQDPIGLVPTPTYASSAGGGEERRAATPRHDFAHRDSSQMQSALGADVGRPPSTHHRVPTPSSAATPTAQPQDTPRLVELRHALSQLELQLQRVASGGRDSGSEAKYYALTKRLQRVRAEVLKEQREIGEVDRAAREAQQQRAARDEHRRQFRR